jgi:hypothetical protein
MPNHCSLMKYANCAITFQAFIVFRPTFKQVDASGLFILLPIQFFFHNAIIFLFALL